jgi:hypothetical protein
MKREYFMKKNILLALIVLFYSSYSMFITYPTKDELNKNYEIIDRIVKNPDSLDIFIKNDNITRYHIQQREYFRLYDMVKRKIKENDFIKGYTITDEQVKYADLNRSHNDRQYFNHSMFIKSNNTGKRIFFQFDNYENGIWKIFEIHTIILSKDSILEF